MHAFDILSIICILSMLIKNLPTFINKCTDKINATFKGCYFEIERRVFGKLLYKKMSNKQWKEKDIIYPNNKCKDILSFSSSQTMLFKNMQK